MHTHKSSSALAQLRAQHIRCLFQEYSVYQDRLAPYLFMLTSGNMPLFTALGPVLTMLLDR